jgi:hypothetical protein
MIFSRISSQSSLSSTSVLSRRWQQEMHEIRHLLAWMCMNGIQSYGVCAESLRVAKLESFKLSHGLFWTLARFLSFLRVVEFYVITNFMNTQRIFFVFFLNSPVSCRTPLTKSSRSCIARRTRSTRRCSSILLNLSSEFPLSSRLNCRCCSAISRCKLTFRWFLKQLQEPVNKKLISLQQRQDSHLRSLHREKSSYSWWSSEIWWLC